MNYNYVECYHTFVVPYTLINVCMYTCVCMHTCVYIHAYMHVQSCMCVHVVVNYAGVSMCMDEKTVHQAYTLAI